MARTKYGEEFSQHRTHTGYFKLTQISSSDPDGPKAYDRTLPLPMAHGILTYSS